MSLVMGQSYLVRHAVPEGFLSLEPDKRDAVLGHLRDARSYDEAERAEWAINADRAWQRFGRPGYPASSLWGYTSPSARERVEAVLDVGVTAVSPTARVDDLAHLLDAVESRGRAVVERVVDRSEGEDGVIVIRDLIASPAVDSRTQPTAVIERFLGARIIEPGLLAIATLTSAGLSPISDAGTMVGELLMSATITNGGSR